MNLKLLFLCLAAAGSCYAIEYEFGEGCQFIDGECYKRCAKGTHEYMSACDPSIPTWSEPTCENPVAEELGTICDMSVCYCDPPTIRDTINKKCVLPEDCPAPGSKPTGPPIDDSYLLVDQGPIRPEPIQNKEDEVSSNDDLNQVVVEKPQPKYEFGEGCIYIRGKCYKRCAKGTHAYMSSCSTSHPTWSEITCENPVVREMQGAICGLSRCDCDSPTIRDTINNKCVLIEDCPAPGSKPTGPPIDDSYLLVDQGPTRPEPIQNKENEVSSNDDLNHVVVEKPQPEVEFGIGCLYVNGLCHKRCPKGTYAYTSPCSPSTPTWSESTCENPVVKDIGPVCGISRCECQSPTLRDTINNKCVLAHECPPPGSQPTGPPIDDSYLYVEQPGEPRPEPMQSTGNGAPSNDDLDQMVVEKPQPKYEFGEGCIYIRGKCYKRCAKGTHAYMSSCSTSHPTWSQITCENPVVREMQGAICGLSRCDCDPPTVRDTINNKCVLPEDCPAPGSKPTGPPVDDSYLLVDQGPTPPDPDKPEVSPQSPETEYGVGCLYILGSCHKRCAKGTHAYVSPCNPSIPTWSEITCEEPVARDIGNYCDLSRCDCDPPTVRDTINNKCVLPEDCPAPGSKPTGPPVDDSYLLVDQGPTPPDPSIKYDK